MYNKPKAKDNVSYFLLNPIAITSEELWGTCFNQQSTE